jgi:hypothetical protein
MDSPPDKTIFDLLVWVCGGLVGLVVSIQQKILGQHGKDIVELQKEVAAEKAKREEISYAITSLRQTVERGFERLYDKLDGKEDKA